MTISDADVENWFRYHPPMPGQIQKYEAIRDQAKVFARVLLHLTPAGHEQTSALTKVREAVALAHESIACQSWDPDPLVPRD